MEKVRKGAVVVYETGFPTAQTGLQLADVEDEAEEDDQNREMAVGAAWVVEVQAVVVVV